MSVSICKHVINAQTKEAVTKLIDCFGTSQIVQTPLLSGRDHDAEVSATMAEMQAAEDAFIAALRARKMSDGEIDALKKNPNDCGCGA